MKKVLKCIVVTRAFRPAIPTDAAVAGRNGRITASSSFPYGFAWASDNAFNRFAHPLVMKVYSRCILLFWVAMAAGSIPAGATPPTIITPPQSVDTVPGGNATIYVQATGAPAPRFQWRLNGITLLEQTNNILTFANAKVQDGGSYTVRVWNSLGAVTAGPAVLRVMVGGIVALPSDDFASRPTTRALAGAVQGSSLNATLEANEPVPDGAGRSVWLEWEARANGVAAFDTQGSALDTLLDIFTGDQLLNLVPVTRDDDGGGYYTSQVRFNAQAGLRYQVRMAGFGYKGQGGEFTINWHLSAAADPVPVILSQPVTQGVLEGSNATFQVSAVAPGASYQWYLNGSALAGATAPAYTVLAADANDVGLYAVRVTSNTGESTESVPVGLQLTSGSGATVNSNFLALIQDKFQNVGSSSANGNRPGAGWVSLGLGELISKQVFSAADDQEGDPNPCNAPLFGTLYQGVAAGADGIIQVDTIASAIDARLAVYRGAPGLGEVLLVCDLTSGPLGQPCLAQFDATGGTNYSIIVEGYQATGTLRLNCQLGRAPIIPEAPAFCWVNLHSDLALAMPATNWYPSPVIQWRLNGVNLVGETNDLLQLVSLNEANQGVYSVVMSNFVRVATNTVAHLTLPGPFLLSVGWSATHKQLLVRASNSTPFILETALDVAGPWQPVATNIDPCVMLVQTNANIAVDPRRFFRAVPWQVMP